MKIAFRGFRGFGPDTPLIDLRDITLFTGKNGSGKSTFIKLLRLMSESLKSVHTMVDLVQMKVNVGTDSLGSVSTILFDVKNVKPQWIFSMKSDFYINDFLVVIHFEVINETLLGVSRIELTDQEKWEKSSLHPLVVWTKNDMYLNLELLSEIYSYSAKIRNISTALEINPRRANRTMDGSQSEGFDVLNDEENQMLQNFSDVEKEEAKKLFHSRLAIGNLYFKNKYKVPFSITDTIAHEHGAWNDYIFIFSSFLDLDESEEKLNNLLYDLTLSDQEILSRYESLQEKIIDNFNFNQLIINNSTAAFKSGFFPYSELLHDYYPNLPGRHFYPLEQRIWVTLRKDFISDLINYTELDYISDNYFFHEWSFKELIEEDMSKNLEYYDDIADSDSLQNDLENFEPSERDLKELDLKFFDQHFQESLDILYHKMESWIHNQIINEKKYVAMLCNDIIKKLNNDAYQYYKSLGKISKQIFESNILKEAKRISEITFQSNVTYEVDRSFNIYKDKNQYSRLLKMLKTQYVGNQKGKLKGLQKYLRILNIEKSFEYNIQENIGFI